MRSLENSLEKMHFKCNEAENIIVNYQKLRAHLQVRKSRAAGSLSVVVVTLCCALRVWDC